MQGQQEILNQNVWDTELLDFICIFHDENYTQTQMKMINKNWICYPFLSWKLSQNKNGIRIDKSLPGKCCIVFPTT